MAKRLDIDSHVIAYYGFDEANETDQALDEGSSGRHLTVVTSPAAVPARVNNGRIFDGSSTYAYPSDHSPFRLAGDLTFILWPTLAAVNNSGSLRRCMLECGNGDILYGLYVDSQGRLIYEHDSYLGQVVLKTAVGSIKTNRYYSFAFRRTSNVITLQRDNKSFAWESCTVGGVSQDPTLPVPEPTLSNTESFYVGKSMKYVDAFWSGTIDELSVHDISRSENPYLRRTYFRLTLYSNFFRLTGYDSVKSVGSAEMGGGSRWWVYERDQSLYSVREDTLGYFSAEVLLTSGGLQPNGTIAPGGTSSPELLYDETTDTLYVAFISSGRVFKLTASSSDAPGTKQMPYTVDTAGIVKMMDSNEGIRLGSGGGVRVSTSPITTVNRQPIKYATSDSLAMAAGGGVGTPEKLYPNFAGGAYEATTFASTINFTGYPSFGIFMSDGWATRYAVYSRIAGVDTRLGTISSRDGSRSGLFWPIPTRVYGMVYFVRGIDEKGREVVVSSNIIQDFFGEVITDITRPSVLMWNKDGDQPETVFIGGGEGLRWRNNVIAYTNRTPIKTSAGDSLSVGSGAGLLLTIGCTASPTAPQRKRVIL
jgi:hypothetical protein